MRLAVLNKTELTLANFSGTDDNRPMLTNILVRRNGDDVEFVTTDSYIAVIYKSPLQEKVDFEPFLIPAKVFNMLYKLAGKHKVPERNKVRRIRGLGLNTVLDLVEIHETYAIIPTLGVTVAYEAVEEPAKYPDLDRLIRELKKEKETTVILNHKYLATATKFVADTDNSAGAIEIEFTGKLSPVFIRSNRATAIVMPLRK